MKYGIISDIHSNIEALNTVLDDMGKVDEIICLGDIVGYGASPNACIKKVKEITSKCLAGNHDQASIGKESIFFFNREAQDAIKWTANQLSAESKHFLESLKNLFFIKENILAVHGSPGEFKWDYIIDISSADMIFKNFIFDILFVGHSHIAECFSLDKEADRVNHLDFTLGGNIHLLDNERYIINCGSVGQPRDGNPKASYGIFDDKKRELTVKRVEYPIYLAQKKILNTDLPEIFAFRLEIGR